MIELIGKFWKISCDPVTGQCLVTFALQNADHFLEQVHSLTEKLLSIRVGQQRKKRSLDANAYHWVLVGKIARHNGTTDKEEHYNLMCDYGTELEDADGNAAVIYVPLHVDLRRTNTYVRHLGHQSMRGIRCQKCILIKPSHEYNSAEMAKLIRGTIEEAKWLGIETIPPEELKRMMEALEEHECRTQKKHENKGM